MQLHAHQVGSCPARKGRQLDVTSVARAGRPQRPPRPCGSNATARSSGAPRRTTARAAAAAVQPGQPSLPAFPNGGSSKDQQVAALLAAKEASGKSFSEIAAELGLTNVYCTQLFYLQQQLQPNTVKALQAAVPALSESDLEAMQRAPMRSFDASVLQEPSVYRLYEAITHSGEALKALINEEFGDGIMSAIDFYCTVDKLEGRQGERRVVITFNGKFLPFVEGRCEDNVAHRS